MADKAFLGSNHRASLSLASGQTSSCRLTIIGNTRTSHGTVTPHASARRQMTVPAARIVATETLGIRMDTPHMIIFFITYSKSRSMPPPIPSITDPDLIVSPLTRAAVSYRSVLILEVSEHLLKHEDLLNCSDAVTLDEVERITI
jgi:hypothetical protein